MKTKVANLAEEIVGRLVRRHSTASVLFHHAIAERLGLGATDHRCLDLMRDRDTTTGSDLVAITGLTSGAITGVVARLEHAGYVHRAADPRDGRKQTLRPSPDRVREVHALFEPIHDDMAALVKTFDGHQLAAIGEFLDRGTDLIHRHAALLRAQHAAVRSGFVALHGERPHGKDKSAIGKRKKRNVVSKAHR